MDAALKQRMVGALVLIALAVIFIPMVLEGPPADSVESMDLRFTPRRSAPGTSHSRQSQQCFAGGNA